MKINSLGYGNGIFFTQQTNTTSQSQAKKDLINKNYNEIYAHELAHKTAGGNLAGSIVIERNSDGIPISGHVAIKMPTINPDNPKKTIEDANIVIHSAMAPIDPSSQDYNVAYKARSIKSEAQSLQNKNNEKKKLNYIV